MKRLLIITLFIEQILLAGSVFGQTDRSNVQVLLSTASVSDSLIFQFVAEDSAEVWVYYEDNLNGKIPQFIGEKTFLIQPQKRYSFVSVRDLPGRLDMIFHSKEKLRELYEKTIPLI